MRFFLFALLFLLVYSCKSQQKNEFLGIPESEIETTVINHLNDWYPRVIDTINGGYFTNFEYNWERSTDQVKMIVTQARDLWTASKAAQLFPENEIYKKAADHGYQYLINKMWDNNEGGFHLTINPEEETDLKNHKLIYGNTFALFALAEYSKINSSDI
jgi:mannobiose 2-epimerase